MPRFILSSIVANMIREPGSKCHFCPSCDGRGCVSELPGMGGVFENANFIDNCAAWRSAAYSALPGLSSGSAELPRLRLAPITGALQNIGYHDEREYYFDMIEGCLDAGLALSIGDGYPDEKLKYGIEALAARSLKGAVFIKPYPNERILERMEWAENVSEIVGVDIDSYAIVTMRNLVNLQEKSAADLKELMKAASVPFAVKGVFKRSDLDLVRELRPDIVVVSNHGGRVETDRGSTAAFLSAHGAELARHCGEVWVDGGIRTARDARIAKALGAAEVLIGRPLITALLKSGPSGIADWLANFTQAN